MIEAQGDLWSYWTDGQWITITTNGYVRRDGALVMGRGIAREAANHFAHLATDWGNYATRYGNHVIRDSERRLFSFPVKHRWDQPADLDLIRRSAIELTKEVVGLECIFLPRVGCGNGQLDWTDVKPILEEAFDGDERYIIVDRNV